MRTPLPPTVPAGAATDRERSPGRRWLGLAARRLVSPAPAEPVRRSANVGRRLWLVCVILVVLVLLTSAAVIWRLRQEALAGSQRELTNLGIVLAEQTSRTLQSVDLVLRQVQTRSASLGIRSPEQFRARMSEAATHQFLVSGLRNLPQADAIAVVAADGALLDWTRGEPVPNTDFSDRDYFRYLSTHDDPDAFISEPTNGRFSGKWIMFIARRVNGPDGTFLGVVAGLIDTRYLEDFYQTISMVPGELVTVLRRDGVVIAGHPDIANRRGKLMPPRSPWYQRVIEGGGSYQSPGYLIDVPQIITVHPLRDYPLVVDVNMSVRAALENWYAWATIIAFAGIGVAAGTAVLFAVIIAQFRRQQQAEAALRASERRLNAYAEMSADWFWEQDAELRFTRDSNMPLTGMPLTSMPATSAPLTSTRLTGLPPTGMPPTGLPPTGVPPTGLPLTGAPNRHGETKWGLADAAMDPGRWDAHMADLAARRPFRDFRWEMFQTDGKRRYISISGDPFYDEAGTFLGYHGTGRDVTADIEAAQELRAAKDSAEAASRAKSEFLTNMSHELRTPLHAVIGFSELIQAQADGPVGTNYVAWAGDILSAGRHLLDVINGVLELSRIEAGRYDLADDAVNLGAVARDCVGMVRLQAESNQIHIECAITPTVLRADRQAVKQIVLNLLSNAVKFTLAGGIVLMRAEPTEDGGIALTVRDNGIGIDPRVLASLGEPFIQADASTSRKYGGTGLGLTISRRLMALHGGTLAIESELTAGTTVRITFPAARVVENSPDGEQTADPARVRAGDMIP